MGSESEKVTMSTLGRAHTQGRFIQMIVLNLDGDAPCSRLIYSVSSPARVKENKLTVIRALGST